MTILIVDDESNTRESLRDLLACLGGGHKVLEARNGEEALRVLDAEKSRIRMIVADWEMPYLDGLSLARKVGERPELDLAPFLLITSDMPRSRLAEYQRQIPRLDGCLIKPFRSKALSEALSQAHARRQAARSLLAYYGKAVSGPFQRALAAAQPPFWRGPLHAADAAALAALVSKHARELGALVLDPAALADPAERGALETWLSGFAKTPLGSATLSVCASREAEAIYPIRTLCQLFVPAGADAAEWSNALARMRERALSSWDVENLFQETKAAIQARDPAAALKHARAMAALDAGNAEVQAMLGELLAEKGDRARAIECFRAALRSNPCLPRPNLKLLEALSRAGDRDASAAAAADAVAYCPQNPDALLAAARAFRAAREPEKAREALRRLLERQPDHPEARELWDELAPA